MKHCLVILTFLLLAASAGAGEYFFQNTASTVDSGPIDDAFCHGYEGDRDRNTGSYQYLILYRTSAERWRWQLARVDSISTLLDADAGQSGLTIDTAIFYMYFWSSSSGLTINAHRCLKPWNEGTKKWTTATEGEVSGRYWYWHSSALDAKYWDCDTNWQGSRQIYVPGYDCAGGSDDDINTCANGYIQCAQGDSCYDYDSTLLASYTFGASWAQFDVTDYIQDCYDNDEAMNIMVVGAYAYGTHYAYGYSSNWSSQASRPYLRVVYSSGTPPPEPDGNIKGVTLKGVTLESQ